MRMKSIKMTLCPPCPDCPPSSECPEVEITGDRVTIGERGNLTTLTHSQWNELVRQILTGEFPPCNIFE
jgi:hypothetical protein